MPAPGEQHLHQDSRVMANPFEEAKPQISLYTAAEIATLSSKLEKQLGPEYISDRQGPGGGKVYYLAAEKCIQLANEVFGFNGWSSQIMDVQVDFVEENPKTLRVNLGLSVTVRVTLKDGTFHEDIGYGHMENSKGKAAAFEKAKKEGTTDGLKRALRNFGNVLGNCIYDKEYLKQVTKIKAHPTRLHNDRFENRLHRHGDFIKREPNNQDLVKTEDNHGAASILTDDTLIGDDDDEYGDFDEADLSIADPDLNSADPDSHPDEVILPPASEASRHLNPAHIGQTSKAGLPDQNRTITNEHQASMQQNRPIGQLNANTTALQQPLTPNSALSRSNSGSVSGPRIQAHQSAMQPPHLNLQAGRVLNQPSRNNIPGPLSGPPSPAKANKPSVHPSSDPDVAVPPQSAGFYSARAVVNLPEPQPNATEPAQGPPPPIPNNLPAFNVHAESPSIRKTPGVDHRSSKPLTKDLKHVSGQCSQAAPSGAGRGNVINPQLDSTRRIGQPGSPSPGGFGRGAGGYKPPTMKRPIDAGGINRVPLNDLGANMALGPEGGNVKRLKTDPL